MLVTVLDIWVDLTSGRNNLMLEIISGVCEFIMRNAFVLYTPEFRNGGLVGGRIDGGLQTDRLVS